MADVTYPCYIQRKDASNHWYWVYYAKNGEAISRSSESYVARSDCSHGIELMKWSTTDPVFYYD
jgi:uncharacterized protein YegP (UPF0339 family)